MRFNTPRKLLIEIRGKSKARITDTECGGCPHQEDSKCGVFHGEVTLGERVEPCLNAERAASALDTACDNVAMRILLEEYQRDLVAATEGMNALVEKLKKAGVPP